MSEQRPVKTYRKYANSDILKLRGKLNTRKPLEMENNVPNRPDLGACLLTRKNGRNHVYLVRNHLWTPDNKEPTHLRQAQVLWLEEHEKLPELPYCLSHIL